MTAHSDNSLLGSLITISACGYLAFRTFNYLLLNKFFKGTVSRMAKIQQHRDLARNVVC
jgi:hypothetical protein